MSNVIEMYEQLKNWDMSLIKRFCVDKGIYSAGEVDEAEDEYKKWLALAFVNLKRGRAISISATVDKFWHAHLLFTQNYISMCFAFNGAFMHHRPAILDDDQSLQENYARFTVQEYKKHFGEMGPMWDSVVCKCMNNCCTDAPAKDFIDGTIDKDFFLTTVR